MSDTPSIENEPIDATSIDTTSIGQLLRAARPDRLAEVTAGYAVTEFGASDVEILLADYRTEGLWPVLGESSAAGSVYAATAAGRAFGSQRTVIEALDGTGTRVLTPLTVWSDRLGLLVLELAEPPDEAYLDALRTVADQVAIALAVADRSTDRYAIVRRRRRLTLAAEMQWDLLPGRAIGGDNFLLAGQLEPAYAVSGDHFDWSMDGRRLTMTVLNGDGSGLDATMLTTLTVAAMRNARRSGGNLVEQAELASDAIYGVHGGERSVGTLLLEVDLDEGRVTAIDAGSPQAFGMRGTQASQIKLDDQLPLGMFADSRYDTQTFTLEPGERLFVLSDGVHTAAPGGRVAYGETSLLAALRGTRLQPATEAVGSVMRGLRDYHRGEDLADDAVIVCLDWHGPPQEAVRQV